jgi:hypothetical protein
LLAGSLLSFLLTVALFGFSFLYLRNLNNTGLFQDLKEKWLFKLEISVVTVDTLGAENSTE